MSEFLASWKNPMECEFCNLKIEKSQLKVHNQYCQSTSFFKFPKFKFDSNEFLLFQNLLKSKIISLKLFFAKSLIMCPRDVILTTNYDIVYDIEPMFMQEITNKKETQIKRCSK